MTVFVPGETCWRPPRAGRVAFLIDNEDYYAALHSVLSQARRSIYLLGWAFDPRTRLAPDGSEGLDDPDEIGRILIGLTKANPDLDVRLLIWKSALSANGSPDFLGHRASGWFAKTSVKFRLADDLPLGACHHQKVVVIDDRVAFCGGGDIVPNRWDTVEHLADEPRRILPDRVRHPPRHEVTAMVDGLAAQDLGDLFRERWRNAVDEAISPPSAERDPWPAERSPHLSSAQVAVARTQGGWKARPPAQEIRRLTLACIADAAQTIYLENQYFTAPEVTETLAARLRERNGPEVVLIVAARAPSWFDQLTMDSARSAMVRVLQDADKFGRFRAFSPRTASGDRIVVHSKVSIFDDLIARVGSANLNNRSGGLDTECEVAVMADDAEGHEAIQAFRDRLISHFLDVPAQAFAKARAERGSLVGAIDALNGERRLAPIERKALGLWEAFVSAYQFGDPRDVSDNWRLDRRRVRRDEWDPGDPRR